MSTDIRVYQSRAMRKPTVAPVLKDVFSPKKKTLQTQRKPKPIQRQRNKAPSSKACFDAAALQRENEYWQRIDNVQIKTEVQPEPETRPIHQTERNPSRFKRGCALTLDSIFAPTDTLSPVSILSVDSAEMNDSQSKQTPIHLRQQPSAVATPSNELRILLNETQPSSIENTAITSDLTVLLNHLPLEEPSMLANPSSDGLTVLLNDSLTSAVDDSTMQPNLTVLLNDEPAEVTSYFQTPSKEGLTLLLNESQVNETQANSVHETVNHSELTTLLSDAPEENSCLVIAGEGDDLTSLLNRPLSPAAQSQQNSASLSETSYLANATSEGLTMLLTDGLQGLQAQEFSRMDDTLDLAQGLWG